MTKQVIRPLDQVFMLMIPYDTDDSFETHNFLFQRQLNL